MLSNSSVGPDCVSDNSSVIFLRGILSRGGSIREDRGALGISRVNARSGVLGVRLEVEELGVDAVALSLVLFNRTSGFGSDGSRGELELRVFLRADGLCDEPAMTTTTNPFNQLID